MNRVSSFSKVSGWESLAAVGFCGRIILLRLNRYIWSTNLSPSILTRRLFCLMDKGDRFYSFKNRWDTQITLRQILFIWRQPSLNEYSFKRNVKYNQNVNYIQSFLCVRSVCFDSSPQLAQIVFNLIGPFLDGKTDGDAR